MRKLIIVAEFDESSLKWEGTQPVDMVNAYNEYYKETPWEAFEIAMTSDEFRVVEARIE